MVVKTSGGRGMEIDVCDQNKSHQVFAQSLHPTCSLAESFAPLTSKQITAF